MHMPTLSKYRISSSHQLSVLLLVFAFFSQVAVADVTTTPGTSCSAITPSQAKRMEFREYGIINRDPSLDLWVVCPLLRDATEGYEEPIYFAAASVAFFNPEVDSSSASTEVFCSIREFVGANRIRSGNRTVDIPEQQQAAVFFSRWVMRDPATSHFLFVCKLPPDSGIAALLSEIHGSEGSMIEDSLVDLGLILP
jgi:hypothetical protein